MLQSDLQGAAAGGVFVGTERGHGYLEVFTKETFEDRILEVADLVIEVCCKCIVQGFRVKEWSPSPVLGNDSFTIYHSLNTL